LPDTLGRAPSILDQPQRRQSNLRSLGGTTGLLPIRIRPFSQRNADHSSLSISLRRSPAIVARRKILNCSGSSVESSALAFSINLTTSKLERYFMLCRGSKLIPSKGRGLGSLTDSRCLVTSALKRDFARRKMELTEILAERFLVSSLPARLRDGWLFENADPALRTGLRSSGPCGTDLL